jgi:D-glycero-D-manno-heptose 1,7-bisphosphate phosphatase
VIRYLRDERAPAHRGAHRPAAFLDRDGVLNRRVLDGYVTSPEGLEVLPGALPAVVAACRLAIPVVIVSNQGGIGRGVVTEGDVLATTGRLLDLLDAAGIRVSAVYMCPHHPAAGQHCTCRKPEPGLLLAASLDLGIDLSKSMFVGDQGTDRDAALAAGLAADAIHIVDAAAMSPADSDSLRQAVETHFRGAVGAAPGHQGAGVSRQPPASSGVPHDPNSKPAPA